MSNLLQSIFDRNPNEPEFHQAVDEVYETVEVVLKKNTKYQKAKLFERMTEPWRMMSFRVTWVVEEGEVQIDKGGRGQRNSGSG
ncbi:MAG: glutamate dehydrogenase, partial [Fulvivirga sp.]